jgi:hypothetical protein
MLEQFSIMLGNILFVLSEGYLVVAPLLWLTYKFNKRYAAISKELLINLGYVLIFIAFGYSVDRSLYYVDSLIFGDEHESYAASKRLFGPYWFGFWIPILLNFGVIAFAFVKASRLKLEFLIFSFLVCLNWPLPQLIVWISNSHSDFITPSYHYSLPELLWVLAAFIVNAGLCLLIISIPQIIRFIRKR